MSVLAAICLFCRPCVRLSLPPAYYILNPIRLGLDPETMLVFCFVFLKTFEEGGIGAQKVDVS